MPHNVLWSKTQVPYQTLSIKTMNKSNHFEINENGILSTIKNPNASKAHGWDRISIIMIKLSCKTIAIPLKPIFRSMLGKGVLPDDCKKVHCSSNPQEGL